MDCRRCIYVAYNGCPHCTHPGHRDVVIPRRNGRSDGSRPYSREICKDFVLRRKCSNCLNWIRGEYFADGVTPATKGKCRLRCQERGEDCPLWEPGKTSWRKGKTGNTVEK